MAACRSTTGSPSSSPTSSSCRSSGPVVTETTALGAAYLAGLTTGVFGSTEDIAARWQSERRFAPAGDEAARAARYAGWRDAVGRVVTKR
jgi:glycerol kinase